MLEKKCVTMQVFYSNKWDWEGNRVGLIKFQKYKWDNIQCSNVQKLIKLLRSMYFLNFPFSKNFIRWNFKSTLALVTLYCLFSNLTNKKQLFYKKLENVKNEGNILGILENNRGRYKKIKFMWNSLKYFWWRCYKLIYEINLGLFNGSDRSSKLWFKLNYIY